MFDLEIKGLKNLQRSLDKLSRRATQLDGERSVPLAELLDNLFIRGCSRFGSLQEMFDAAPVKIQSDTDLKTEEWNRFVSENTKFSSWEKMLSAASERWAARKLGL